MALGVSEQVEQRMISDRAARNKQNTKIPFLINIKDARLVPNVPALAGRPAEKSASGHTIPAKPPHPNYRPYTGSLKAPLEERMKWLETLGTLSGPREVSLANLEPFDVGTATLDECIEFAQNEYGVEVKRELGLKGVRAAVVDLYKKASAARAAGDGDSDKLN